MRVILSECWLLGVLVAVNLGAAPPATALDGAPEATASDTRITDPIADGKPAVPAPPPVPIDFKVKSSTTRRVEIEKAPEFPDLPPIRGTITETVQLVEDPGLTDPQPPVPALAVKDPAVLARMAELRGKYLARQIAFVSATVYDHSRTYLRCYPNGEPGNVICAWSNINFDHFCGFGTFQATGKDGKTRQYMLLMGISDVNTQRVGEWVAKRGHTYQAPEAPALPALATGGPAFVIADGDTTNQESMALIEGMHDLYRVEGQRMEAAYHARIKAEADRKAYLLANPPVPQDTTIRYWKRKSPSPAGMKNLEERTNP